MTSLPLVTLVWTSEDSIVAADHDRQPYVFSGNECGWRPVGILDNTSRFSLVGPGRLNNAAFNTKNTGSLGLSSPGGGGGNSQGESELFTVYQNTITGARPYEGQSGAIPKVSTTGVGGAGRLKCWSAMTAVTMKFGNIHLR